MPSDSSLLSRGDSFPPVFVMEAAENCASRDVAVLNEGMSIVTLPRQEYRGRFRNPRSEAQMGAALVVVRHPLCQDSAQMFLVQRNHEIQTLPPYASHQTFAMGVRFWCSHGCVQHPQSKSLELLVHLSREDRVTVTDQETVRMITWDCFAKLLQGPGCRWMRGDVAMHDAPCPDLHQEEHIESSEPSGYHDQEIAGDDGLGVIADKRPPVL